MIKGAILQEDIALTTINVYIPKSRTTTYMRQKYIILKVELDKSTIILENVTLFSQ